MAKTANLDDAFWDAISHGIRTAWNAIGYEMDDISDEECNLEMVTNVLYQYDGNADMLFRAACKVHGYEAVQKFVMSKFSFTV